MERLLIVEGEEDRKFFVDVLAVLQINTKVINPEIKVVVQSKRGKNNALETFVDRLSGLRPSEEVQIGLVVDSDHPHFNQNSGFEKTKRDINNGIKSKNKGFSELTTIPSSSGYMSFKNGFEHVKAGVWIMPNNQEDGSLEHFSIKIISESEKARFEFARDQTQKIMDGAHQGPEFSFKAHQFEKAAIGAWLAWSDPPRMGLGFALKEKKRLDTNHVEFNKLKTWLHWLYGSNPA
jgi:hypothetical protein